MTAPTNAPDPAQIGISYSGGGPLVVVELGIARAFVQQGIKPAVITGASAGAIAGAAHALDITNGKGIDLALGELERMSNATLRLDAGDFALRLLHEGAHLKGVGDNQPLADMASRVVAGVLGSSNVTLGAFGQPLGGVPSPQLQIVATDLVTEAAYWFPPAATLQEALVASSAIPGIFPWQVNTGPDGTQRFLVDGGVVENQPLQLLADVGCGTIYACVVGGVHNPNEPSNLVDNVLRSVNIAIHESSKIEEDFLRHTLPSNCRVIHIHPPITTPLPDFNFTPGLVQQVADQATQLTVAWLQTNPQT
jgi:NTE family protein